MDTDYQLVLGEAESALDQVDAALGRLVDGSYGTCAACDERIADERLALTPAVATCERHAD